jgi:hypothetical protein
LYVALVVVAVIIAGTGLTLTIGGYLLRPRRDLDDRLRRYQPSSLGDEAQDWLRRQ